MRWTSKILTMASAAALLVVPGVMRAQAVKNPTEESDAGVKSACYVPNSGTVYRVKTADTKDTCASQQHVLFRFNAAGGTQGPQGPQGPQGDPGLQGPQGPAGGVSGYNVNSRSMSSDTDDMGAHEITVSCTSGSVLGGGVSVSNSNPFDLTPSVVASEPVLNGWHGKAVRPTFVDEMPNEPWTLTVSVICATVAP